MKLSQIGKIATLIILVLMGLIYFLKPTELVYIVKGRVAGFSSNPFTILIEHEDIKGYMPAMTMPFKVLDSLQIADLEVSEAISFNYYVKLEEGTSYIDQITILEPNALPKAGRIAKSVTIGVDESAKYLQIGDSLPNYTLVDQDANSFELKSLSGNKLLLTFIYTNCPVPEYCPLMSYNFKQIHEEIKKRQINAILLSISFDVERDKPNVLKAYGQKYTNEFSNWKFVTSDKNSIEQITSEFSVLTQTENNQIIHNLRTVYIDEFGIIQKIWPDNLWTADDVINKVLN